MLLLAGIFMSLIFIVSYEIKDKDTRTSYIILLMVAVILLSTIYSFNLGYEAALELQSQN